MSPPAPRLAVRALIGDGNRVLVVNAFPDPARDLWCLPGGGVEAGASLGDNLRREVAEETGLTISPGAICHVSEFHDPDSGFHQVELIFRATVTGGVLDPAWRDPEGIVHARRFVTAADLVGLRFKPDALPDLAFGTAPEVTPAALVRMVR
jgi:8-oxo-dGTP pyrophosphatase MutT (NUDIX family)